MQNPQQEIRTTIRSLTEPYGSQEILRNVDKYFTADATLVHPMFNSVPRLGREGVKAGYKMLRVLTIGNRIDFHTVAFDEFSDSEEQTCLLDLTEHLQLRLLPSPLRTTIHFRFFIAVTLRKEADGLWRVSRQIDNLPTDLGLAIRGRLFGVVNLLSDLIKVFLGYLTFFTALFLSKTHLL